MHVTITPSAPIDATYITQTANGVLTAEQNLAALATGLLKNATTTGILSIAAESTDYFNPPFLDTNTLVKGSADATKLMRFEVDGFTTGTTRVMTPPNQDTLLAGQDFANTFTVAQTVNHSLTQARSATDLVVAGPVGGSFASSMTFTANPGIGEQLAYGMTYNVTADVNLTRQFVAMRITANWLGAAGLSSGGGFDRLIGGDFRAQSDSNASVSLANMIGGRFGVYTFSSRQSFAANAQAGRFELDLQSSAAHTTTFAAAVYVPTATKNANITITNLHGIYVEAQTIGATNYAIRTNDGLVVFNEAGAAASNVRMEGDTDANLFFTDAANDRVGVGTATPSNKLHILRSDAATGAVVNVQRITLNSTGTAGVGFGPGLIFGGESSATDDQDMGRLYWFWPDAAGATHATRRSAGALTALSVTTERECISWEATSTVAMLGFLGAARIARPTTYTLASTATRTMPTPEAAFTGQDNAQVGSVYAKSADLITLQTRLDNVEGVLRQLIIDLASTSGYGLLVAS